jgi:hypothetical protein
MSQSETMIEVEPRLEPVDLDWLEDFGVGEGSRVSVFDSVVDARDASMCVIRGCGYHLRACLDRCHIIAQSKPEEVYLSCS